VIFLDSKSSSSLLTRLKSETVSDTILKNTKSAQEISKKQTCNMRHKKTFREITQNILKTNLFKKVTCKTERRTQRNISISESEKYYSAASSLCNTSEDEETDFFLTNSVSLS
jgi:hypothetical protein